jgi:hypothetical protein
MLLSSRKNGVLREKCVIIKNQITSYEVKMKPRAITEGA